MQQIVNLALLSRFDDGATVDLESLIAKGLVRARGDNVKLLGEGLPPKNLTVKVHKASAGAKQKIEAAGGTVELLG